MGILSIDSATIRRRQPNRLPKTPTNLNRLDHKLLVDVLDRYGDYWATWLGKSVMFAEYPEAEFYSVDVLRRLIRLVSGKFAQHMYLEDPDSEDGMDLYERFFEKWDNIVQGEKAEAIKQSKKRDKELNILKKQ